MIVINPACDGVGLYGFDTRFAQPWSAAADWAYAGADEPDNVGGLANKAALATAVILSLYTDRRCPPDHPLAKYAEGDLRGWWGEDILEPGETVAGSLLWLLERSVVTDEIRLYADAFTREALAWALAAGVAARLDVDVDVLPARNGFSIAIALYGRDGALVHDCKYESAWAQAAPDGRGGSRI